METPITSILERIATDGAAYTDGKLGSREALIEHSRNLIASLELPSEFLQRSFWAEPALSANCRFAAQVKLFQHVRDVGDSGISAHELGQKTNIDTALLLRILRHFVAMKMVTFKDGAFFGTPLSDGLAADNYQKSLEFCYDVSRPAFNVFPAYFAENGYKNPMLLANGPFQMAHRSNLPFFPWLMARVLHLDQFGAFMSAYRAGKANWYDFHFYPTIDRLFEGFDSSESEVLLVDVGGGEGHDMQMFTNKYPECPGKIVLQDKEEVIANINDKGSLPFQCRAHNFFTRQPINSARAYALHSVLHDWSDEDAVEILKQLRPALEPNYSRVLLIEIVLSEERATIAATSMDMMMLAHLNSQERTETQWKSIAEMANLRFTAIYNYPGVAESVIELEL